MLDISIVGAGPAGSSAAKILAENGFKVAIFEKERLPRHKHCGGGVSIYCSKYLEQLDVDIQKASLQDYTGFSLSYGDLSAKCDLKTTIGYGVYREDFDYLITESAIKAGSILNNKKITGLKKVKNYYNLLTKNGSYKTKYVLGADGINSTIRKCIGIPYERDKLAVSLEAEVKTTRKKIEEYNNMVNLDLKYFDQGYAWDFPKIGKKTINFGVGTFLTTSKNMEVPLREVFYRFLKDKGFKNNIKDVHGALLPFRGTVDYFGKENVILIGDAAGLVSPLSGEGVPYALESGITVANCIKDHFNDDNFALQNYEERLSHLKTELNKHAIVLQNKLYGTDSHRKLIVRICKENPRLIEDIGKIFMHMISYESGVTKFSTINLIPKIINAIYKESFLSPVEEYHPKPASSWVRM